MRRSRLLEEAGTTVEEIEEMARLFAVAKHNERFVIPTARREMIGEAGLHYRQGACSLEGITPESGFMSQYFAKGD